MPDEREPVQAVVFFFLKLKLDCVGRLLRLLVQLLYCSICPFLMRRRRREAQCRATVLTVSLEICGIVGIPHSLVKGLFIFLMECPKIAAASTVIIMLLLYELCE